MARRSSSFARRDVSLRLRCSPMMDRSFRYTSHDEVPP